VDFAAGMLGAIASLIAQLRKIQTGAGAAINTSLMDAGLFLLSELVQAADGRSLDLPVLNHTQTGFHPAEQLYQARDGWVGIAARGEAMGRELLGVLALDRDIVAPRQAWGAAEADRIAAAIAGWDCAKLLAALRAAGVWAVRCRTDAENAVLSDPVLEGLGVTVASHYPHYGEVRQLGMLFSLSRSKAVVRGETAALGQHNREILAELGYSESEIARFYDSAVVA
jgi:crotonobetainyl-CoA:carnitine CoA-transferase CaiB-like acyl-CoA transferase